LAVPVVTVALLTNQEHRTLFFSAASAALRQRLAVRVAYRLYLGNPAPAPDTEEKEEQASAPVPLQHQPATAAGTITPGIS
jgi:hypothetical protein